MPTYRIPVVIEIEDMDRKHAESAIWGEMEILQRDAGDLGWRIVGFDVLINMITEKKKIKK